MPDNAYNPEFLYKKYDELKKIKFDDETFLYQSTYEEMINCSYTIKAMIEINSLFSTNEYMEIPTSLCYLKKLKRIKLEWFEYVHPSFRSRR